MSRIGRLPIILPAGVSVNLAGQVVTVTGPKGSLSLTVAEPIAVSQEDGVLAVTRPNDERRSRALHGLSRTLISNMVIGVTTGFEKSLELVGTGYRVAAKGSDLEFQLGFSHPVLVPAPEGISFQVESPVKLKIQGIDKQQVGEVAANIRKIRPPEPYKGKGVRYEGEVIRRKAGKAGKK
ncbi:MAG: 50S ribosomal protein L6 [Candidatus Nanopelagicales bacterium]